MKAFLIAFAVLVLAALAAIAAVSFARNAPTGELVREDRPATGFHRLEINGLVEITLVQGTAEGVTVEAPSSMLRRVRTEVHDGTLIIDATEQRGMWQWFSGRRGSRTTRITVTCARSTRSRPPAAWTVGADSLKAGDCGSISPSVLRSRSATCVRRRCSRRFGAPIKADLAGKVRGNERPLGAGSFSASKLASDEAVIEVSGRRARPCEMPRQFDRGRYLPAPAPVEVSGARSEGQTTIVASARSGDASRPRTRRRALRVPARRKTPRPRNRWKSPRTGVRRRLGRRGRRAARSDDVVRR